MIGVNRDEGALFAYLVNAGANGMTPLEYQALLTGVFGPAGALRVNLFAKGGSLPYTPGGQGALPPWFANSAAAAATSRVLNDYAFRCGSFLAADQVVGASGAPPVYAYIFAQAPIFSSPRVAACNPLPSQPGFQNACHEFELPYVFNSFAATGATTVPTANALLSRRMGRFWTSFAGNLDPGPGWARYRATPLPGGNRIKVLSTGSASTGALAVPADPMAGANCTALWSGLPPFTGSFPAN